MTAATAEMSFGDRAKLWGVAVRAYSFPASIVPIFLGSALAWWHTKQFDWGLFVLTLIAGIFYHVGCNLLNDFYDYKKGVDREGTFGGSGVLVSGQMTPGQIKGGAYTCLFIGTLIGLYFVWHLSHLGGGNWSWGWPMLVIGGLGLIGALWYTHDTGSAKYNALGNPLVFLMFGPGYVLGTYLIQTGELSWGALWASLPVGFLVAAILQANDVRDIVDDRDSGIRTIATVSGHRLGRVLYSFQVFAPYALVVILPALKVLPWSCLLPLLTLPLALQLHKLFWTVLDERSDKLVGTVENTAKLHMGFGLLLTIGVIVGALWLS